MRRKPWVVYSKPPFSGPRKLLDYLGRYTHRVAISDHRIVSCDHQGVCFTYRARGDGNRPKYKRLDAVEFIQPFLTHVLPSGFSRIRHYGLLAIEAGYNHCVPALMAMRALDTGVRQIYDAEKREFRDR